MSKNTQPATVETVVATAEEQGLTVPAQKNTPTAETVVTEINKLMAEKLAAVQDELVDGTYAKVQVLSDGTLDIVIVEEGTAAKLFGKAKGLFGRNKKLVFAGLGLVAASAVIKVLASRQEPEYNEGTIVHNDEPVGDETADNA